MFESLLPLAVGVGLVVSLLFTELFGLAAGGMVVPGYVALHMTHPGGVALTLLAGLLTFVIAHGIGSVTILYGRRRTAITLLLGYLVGYGFRIATAGVALGGPDFDVIGFIIPGLIALWIARQGVIETFAAIITVSAMVRLVLVLAVAEELIRI